MSSASTRRAVLILTATACLATAGCSSTTTPQPATTTPTTSSAHANTDVPTTGDVLLFVARATTGELTDIDGITTLRLDDVATLTWFADRPRRDAGVLPVIDALSTFGWTNNGATLGVPPNAAVTATELGDGTPVIELLNAAVIDGDLMFRVTFDGTQPTAAALTNIELFIDSADPSDVLGQITDTGAFLTEIAAEERAANQAAAQAAAEIAALQRTGLAVGGAWESQFDQTAEMIVGDDGVLYDIGTFAQPGTTLNRNDRVAFEIGPEPNHPEMSTVANNIRPD